MAAPALSTLTTWDTAMSWIDSVLLVPVTLDDVANIETVVTLLYMLAVVGIIPSVGKEGVLAAMALLPVVAPSTVVMLVVLVMRFRPRHRVTCTQPFCKRWSLKRTLDVQCS
ncbi:hypothetical protein JG688_00015104 [Phytophthora aleatoria]|uniref:Uncharacterized protein n=1 Tax=Phytophthora aleatoria TaxID=2496075 RepID=A0A8J5IG77_9STRA|nr:hypothetical protein JG688_00015104 [Phytophthora aleatoria]